MYAHNDALQFSNKLTKLVGTHGLKFGISVERGQKQQNFQNLEAGQLWFGTDNDTGTGNSGADMLVGRDRPVQPGHRRARQPGAGHAVRRVPLLERRRVRAGQLEAAVEPDARIRRALRLLDEQRGAARPRRLLHAGALRLDQGIVPRSRDVPARQRRVLRRDRLRARRRARRTARRSRCRASTSPGTSTAKATTSLRGGYGMFYNRNMGNVEYDNTLRLAPNAYQVATDFWAGGGYGNGLGLTYDTISEATLANRIGSIGINTLTPDSFTFPKTHSFSAVVRAADSVQPGRRGELRRHARPRSGEPQQRQRHAVRRAEHRDLQRRRSVGAGQPRRGGERRRPTSPTFRPVQRAERASRSTTSAASRTTTRCSSR